MKIPRDHVHDKPYIRNLTKNKNNWLQDDAIGSAKIHFFGVLPTKTWKYLELVFTTNLISDILPKKTIQKPTDFIAMQMEDSQSLQTLWLQYHNLIGATRFFVNANRLGVSSQGPALPDVPATVVHQVEHLSPLQVWLFHSGFVRLQIAASPIPHLHLHPRRVTLKLLPFLPLLTADIPARKTIQYFLFPGPRLLPDRPPQKNPPQSELAVSA